MSPFIAVQLLGLILRCCYSKNNLCTNDADVKCVSNSTNWQSLTNLNPIPNESYDTIQIKSTMHISLRMIYYGIQYQSTTNEWHNIFRIGNQSTSHGCYGELSRYPAIWISPDNILQLSLSDATDCNYSISTNFTLQQYTTYNIVIDFNQSWIKMVINNRIIIDQQRPNYTLPHIIDKYLFIWMSTDGYDRYIPSANVTLFDISITSIEMQYPSTTQNTQTTTTEIMETIQITETIGTKDNIDRNSLFSHFWHSDYVFIIIFSIIILICMFSCILLLFLASRQYKMSKQYEKERLEQIHKMDIENIKQNERNKNKIMYNPVTDINDDMMLYVPDIPENQEYDGDLDNNTLENTADNTITNNTNSNNKECKPETRQQSDSMEDMYDNQAPRTTYIHNRNITVTEYIPDKEIEISVEKIYQEYDVMENDQHLSALAHSFTGSNNTHTKSLKIGIKGEAWPHQQYQSNRSSQSNLSPRPLTPTDFKWIEETLKLCDAHEWQRYLINFKRHKVTKSRLQSLNEVDLRELIPEIGPRNEFQLLYAESGNDRMKSFELANKLIEAFTPPVE